MRFLFTQILAVLILYTTGFSQDIKINKIEPPNWWIGMKTSTIQLMVYGKNLNSVSAEFENSAIKVLGINEVENSAYTFIDIEIPSDLKADTYKLKLKSNAGETEIDFPVLARENDTNRNQGFDNNDVIYLITPDRFANGNTGNDEVEGMINDFEPGGRIARHGGDIQGIIDHLNYIKDLGVTAIWSNPLIENNCDISYHGYSATDFYNIDARFGNNELYKKFVTESHNRGLKVILDHVTNHISTNHQWIKNLPMKSWINGSVENHKPAMHHKMVYTDIHGDSSIITAVTEGWFTDSMADLNQKNPFLAKWIIQNTIWWLEYAGIDGIREDTYPYCDQKFMSDWAKAVRDEYPKMKILAEVWSGEPAFVAPYQSGKMIGKNYDSNARAVTDFGLRDVFADYLSGKCGLYKIYSTITKDFLYADPDNLVTFIDNHDVTRMMYSADGDYDKVKIALSILLTTRGIPSIFYATEIGMVGDLDHGYIRGDFPGGFPDSDRNAFTKEGRTDKENDLYNYIKTLLKIRNENPAIRTGRLIHFPPKNNVYTYFKVLGKDIIMIVVNDSDKKVKIDLNDYKSVIGSGAGLKNLITNEVINNLIIENKKAEIFKLAGK
ncbi:MAG: cyclomaltodextrinase N-terminal domain-containing protein [Melioribacteraceae bacterium]|nr:cyclomaltodextrinase N-terminal domain-containing protein [Melioribacteraceae bacterium]